MTRRFSAAETLPATVTAVSALAILAVLGGCSKSGFESMGQWDSGSGRPDGAGDSKPPDAADIPDRLDPDVVNDPDIAVDPDILVDPDVIIDPDVALDPDVVPDIAPDVPPDVRPDAPPDVRPDWPPDVRPDRPEWPDVPVDFRPERPDGPPELPDIFEDGVCMVGRTGDPCLTAARCYCIPSRAKECMRSLAGYIDFPGGYCTARCTSTGDCGPGGVCADIFPGTSYCLDECADETDCRMSEGYTCTSIPMSGDPRTYCLPRFGMTERES